MDLQGTETVRVLQSFWRPISLQGTKTARMRDEYLDRFWIPMSLQNTETGY